MTHQTLSAAGMTEVYASGSKGTKALARIWHGQTNAKHYDEYAAYLYEFGVLKIERMAGNLGVQMLRSVSGDVADFTVISHWPSLDAIAVWSGDDLTRTRHLERDPEFLLALPERVTLVEVYANDWALSA